MKIEDVPGEPKRIVTVRRMGYKWNCGDAPGGPGENHADSTKAGVE